MLTSRLALAPVLTGGTLSTTLSGTPSAPNAVGTKRPAPCRLIPNSSPDPDSIYRHASRAAGGPGSAILPTVLADQIERLLNADSPTTMNRATREATRRAISLEAMRDRYREARVRHKSDPRGLPIADYLAFYGPGGDE